MVEREREKEALLKHELTRASSKPWHYLWVAVCQATAIIRLMGNSTGTTSATMAGWHHNVLKRPFPAPAIKPIEVHQWASFFFFSTALKEFIKCHTSWAVEIVHPAGNGLFESRRHNGRPDNSERDASAFLEEQVLGQCLGECVGVGTLPDQPGG